MTPNSRSYLNRWLSPDSIIPDLYNPLDYDRYSYVRNNPINFSDPSGHMVGKQVTFFTTDADFMWSQVWNVTISGNWTYDDMITIQNEVEQTGEALSTYTGSSASESFNQVIGPTIIRLNDDKQDNIGCKAFAGGFGCNAGTGGKLNRASQVGLIIHELGHVFDLRTGGYASGDLGGATNILDFDGNMVTGWDKASSNFIRTSNGYKTNTYPYMQHPMNANDASSLNYPEDFADMFMNWVQNSFNYDPAVRGAGVARATFMNTNMSEWVSRASR